MNFPKEKLLPVLLTELEKQQRGQILASNLIDLQKMQDEAKESAKSWRNRIKNLEELIWHDSKVLKDGEEKRMVKVKYQSDLGKQKIQTIRIDTGEICEEREATQAERDRLFDEWPEEIGD
jgi:hypothetical protein